jgi:SAM-dependent MidA family methyltransferase
MALALYTPGLGYYANDSIKFGTMPHAAQSAGCGQRLCYRPRDDAAVWPDRGRAGGAGAAVTQTCEVWEFGAGSGALALQLLQALQGLGLPLPRYNIVDLSGSLRARQQLKLVKYLDHVQWVSELPATLQGVVIGNEVLDAMPVKLLARTKGHWYERGVALAPDASQRDADPAFVWQDRATDLRPPLVIEGEHDYLTEIHPQGESFVRTLADKLSVGAAPF